MPLGWKRFLNCPGEELILIKRRHWFVVIMPILLIIIFTFLIIFLLSIIFYLFLSSLFLPLLLGSILFVFTISVFLITKQIIEWNFHIYIVTNRKILELLYVPLSSYVINDVLLDQVKCTEIDAEVNGFVREIIDLGDVIFTFDRPTHQEEFRMRDIASSQEIAAKLSRIFLLGNDNNALQQQRIWFKDKKKPKYYRYTEEINKQI